MTYEEALKAATGKKAETGYFRLKLGYTTGIILPYKEGMTLLSALSQAEFYTSSYNNPPTIRGLESHDLEFEFCSPDERRDLHMAQLLNVTLDNIKNLHDQANGSKEPPF